MFSITRTSCFVISGLIALLCPRVYVSYRGEYAANINFPLSVPSVDYVLLCSKSFRDINSLIFVVTM